MLAPWCSDWPWPLDWIRPLSGASVELLKSGDPPSKAVRLTTDKRGYASLTDATAGNYVALARLTG